jgi:hypothetical protein
MLSFAGVKAPSLGDVRIDGRFSGSMAFGRLRSL